MPKIAEIIQELENLVPIAWQESYDNSGLLVGDRSQEITSVLITLDITEDVIEEAINQEANLIIAHHPIVFSPLKSITGKNLVERCLLKAIKNDIALYAIHTNLDNYHLGVNKKISDLLNLKKQQVLAPKTGTLRKMEVFVPKEFTEKVRTVLNKAGAGEIGNYINCSFYSEGTGTFQPTKEANPFQGESGKMEYTEEHKLEVIFTKEKTAQIISAMKQAHPYEEAAYYLHNIENPNQEIGSGRIGELESEMLPENFLKLLKKTFNAEGIKFTPINKKIKKVAVCGGAGSFLLKTAISQKADAFVSSDFKYHEFFDSEEKIMICDIGHYESEQFTKELIKELITKKIRNIAVNLSKVNTNPVQYFK